MREFSSRDSLIECDAMFAAVAASMPATDIVYDSRSDDASFIARVRSSFGGSLDVVTEASGEDLNWYVNDVSAVYACSTWSKMRLGLSAHVRIWATSDELVALVRSKLTGGL
ncbi:hypothetical protein IOD16_23530 [Saccharothrix sp. 6-C]|uniref:hypothetical protein n=1 Tax=Saccharothrix sp. 6-C TaxID=2781735 RepID=UPI00191719BC|nr:hypothetical protein [Saccharothrix sp. 6-C]QQQ74179.1 hypothetical protein IOD16_23530 [Saccharothrix sp. 6-C]